MTLRALARLCLTASAVALLGTALLATPVAAHAELESSDPPANAVLLTSPQRVVLLFTESVNIVPDSIRLVAADGTGVAIGDPGQDEGGASITVTVPKLANGSYVVVWRAVSADSHPISGAFTFSVGEESATDPDLVSTLLEAERPSRTAEGWLAAGRASSYLGIAVLLGGFVVAAVCAPGIVRTRRLGRLLTAGWAGAVVGTLLMLAAQASLTVGSMTAWGDVIASEAGRWWFVRLLVVAIALPAIFVRERFHGTGVVPTIGLIYAVGLLSVVTAGGHGISGRWIPLGFVATLVHLGAMCLWVGGLTLLATVVPRPDLWRVASRISVIALASVIVLAITGTLNGWRQAASWTALRESDYGTWLLVKLVVIAGVITIAGFNRWLVNETHVAAATPAAGSVGAAAVDKPSIGPAFRRTVLLEAAAMTLVFLATSGLVASPPARDAAASTTVASATAVQGDRIAQLTLDPPVTGGTVMHVYITSAGGSIEQPEITVSASLPSAAISDLDIPATPAGPGHITTSSANLPLPGTWTFTITARFGQFDSTVFTLQLDIR